MSFITLDRNTDGDTIGRPSVRLSEEHPLSNERYIVRAIKNVRNGVYDMEMELTSVAAAFGPLQ
jgi:hypothetical protein